MYKKKLHFLNHLIILLFLLLTISLFNLQIINSSEYKLISENNYVRIKTILPVRGEIYDCKYRSIVNNKSSFNLYISLGKIIDKDKVAKFISNNFDIGFSEVKEIIYRNRFRLYQDILLLQNIEYKKFVEISEQLNYFPSLSFQNESIRDYKYRNHFTGYVSKINEQEYESLKDKGYSINSVIGKTGLEKFYEEQLIGRKGFQIIQVDATGKNLEFFKHNLELSPQNGLNLILSIDNELQDYINSIFPSKINGAVVVIDVRTGGILAYVSKPDFDQNIFLKNLIERDWVKIINDPAKPMLDRIIHGTYPPASVYKPVMASLGLEKEVIDEHTMLSECEGGMQIGERFFKCWWEKGHGALSLLDAIKYSCDVYFYDLSMQLSLESIEEYTKQSMLTIKTGIDLPGERSGFFPTRKWYFENYGKFVGIVGPKVNISIGQGELLVTPLQICSYFAAIANDGKWIQPHLVKKTIEKDKTSAISVGEKKIPVSEYNLNLIQTALYKTVNESYGTGTAAGVEGVTVYGKTGSAENHMGEKTHAWFAGYAKWEEPEIAFVVFFENGGSGGGVAAPVAAKIVDFYDKIKNDLEE